MREHQCLCSACQAKTYDLCKYKSTVGEWKNTPISQIKIKKASEVAPLLQRPITKFFEGAILQNSRTMIVGIKMIAELDKSVHIMLAVIVIPPRISAKATFSEEHTINKRKFVMNVVKGHAVLRVKLLTNHPSVEGICNIHNFFLPNNTKASNISILDIVDPITLINSSTDINRENYIKYRITESQHTNEKNKIVKQKTYHIEPLDLEWLKSHMNL
jgi:hypothetical protein